MKSLIIYNHSSDNSTLSYHYGWTTAFKNSKLFDCDFLNLNNFFPIYKAKPNIEQLNYLLFKKYDCIIGTRFHKLGNYKIDKFNKIQRFLLSFVGTKLCKILLGLNFSDNTGGYICLSSKAIKKILNQKIYSKAHFYHVEIKNIIKDLPNSEIPIIYKKSDTKISNKTILIALLNLGRLSINRFFKKLPVVNSS